MARPLSIKLFAGTFCAAGAISLALAVAAVQATNFGFAMTPGAAAVLTKRIFLIRCAGLAFAALLLFAVFFARSRSARGALALRWLLGLVTSIAFLRGIGVVAPGGLIGPIAVALSIVQLMLEGFAILVLFGPDAAVWFERERMTDSPVWLENASSHRKNFG